MRAPWPLRFVLLAMAWGSTFLFIKIGDEALAPLQVSFGRLLMSAPLGEDDVPERSKTPLRDAAL